MKYTGSFGEAALNVRREFDTRIVVGTTPLYVNGPVYAALYNNDGVLYTAPTTLSVYRGNDGYDHLFIQTGEPITGMMSYVLIWNDNMERDLFGQTLDSEAEGVVAVGKPLRKTYNVDFSDLKDGLLDEENLDFLKTQQYLGELANDAYAKPARFNLGVSRGTQDYFKRNVDVYLLNRTNGMAEDSTIANLNGLLGEYEPMFPYDLITQKNFNSSIRKNRLWYGTGGRGSSVPNDFSDSWVSVQNGGAEMQQVIAKRYNSSGVASEHVCATYVRAEFSLNSGFPAFEDRHVFDIGHGELFNYDTTTVGPNLMDGNKYWLPVQLFNDQGNKYPFSYPGSANFPGVRAYFKYNSASRKFEFYVTVMHRFTAGNRPIGFSMWI